MEPPRGFAPRTYALRARSGIALIIWYQWFWVYFGTGSSGLFEVVSVSTEGTNSHEESLRNPSFGHPSHIEFLGWTFASEVGWVRSPVGSWR